MPWNVVLQGFTEMACATRTKGKFNVFYVETAVTASALANQAEFSGMLSDKYALKGMRKT
jgi:hypothetical protein